MRSQFIVKINANQKDEFKKKKNNLKDKEVLEKLSLFKRQSQQNNIELELSQDNLNKQIKT